jgi:cobalt-zinc-cadmium efflux system membrane fusion protein
MKRNILYLIVLGIALQACQSKEPTATDAKVVASEDVIILNKTQLSNIPMSIIKIEERSLGNIIRANGSIDVPPQSLVNISAPFGGYLKYTELLPGLKVRKGELLAVLEDQQYIQMGQDYLSAKNKMELARIEKNCIQKKQLQKRHT